MTTCLDKIRSKLEKDTQEKPRRIWKRGFIKERELGEKT